MRRKSKLVVMKKVLFILLVVSLASCQQKEIERMQAVQDSIMQVSVEKDSAITNFVSAMTEIQSNLDSIKQIEDLVKVETSNGSELRKEAKDQIMDDINVIHELLQKNKDLVANLERQLGASNVRVTELQNAIAILNNQIEQKDAEIARLNADLENLQINIAGLNTRIEDITAQNVQKDEVIEQRDQTIEQQTIDLNTAYYAFGTSKELIDNGVVESQGGILGIGRTLVMKKDFNKDYFTTIDIRNFKNLELYVKKAELITTHPDGSYHFEGEDIIDRIVIDDAQAFWSTSKYLIIDVK